MVAKRIITPTELDIYLSKGYFRMTDQIFTTDYIPFQDRLYRVHWLRFVISTLSYSREARRLFRANHSFTQEIIPYKPDVETLELYDRFRKSRKLYLDTALHENFSGQSGINPLDTWMIKVRDGDKLIACGYFDQGERTVAGILNIYEPEYEKCSLGKLLMLLKIEYCLQNKLQYYYPGYIISGLDRFDYKLFPCKHSAEVYDTEAGEWKEFTSKPNNESLLITKELIETLRGNATI